MKYRVHRLEVKGKDVQTTLEQFLNTIEGEVISVFPNINKLSLPQIYGATEKVSFLMIVEKIKS